MRAERDKAQLTAERASERIISLEGDVMRLSTDLRDVSLAMTRLREQHKADAVRAHNRTLCCCATGPLSAVGVTPRLGVAGGTHGGDSSPRLRVVVIGGAKRHA